MEDVFIVEKLEGMQLTMNHVRMK